MASRTSPAAVISSRMRSPYCRCARKTHGPGYPTPSLSRGNLMFAAALLGVLHQYASVALSPDGKLIASVETVRKPNATTEEHGAVVVRGTDGAVRARLDPCAKCRYA